LRDFSRRDFSLFISASPDAGLDQYPVN